MFWSKSPKSKHPSSRNAVKDGVDDELITTTLSIFTFVASLLEPSFKKYQCDKPMTYVSRFKIFDAKFAWINRQAGFSQSVWNWYSTETIESFWLKKSTGFEGHKSGFAVPNM